MNIGGIIFSRMSSSRLPGKALIDIDGKTLLERVIERSKKIRNINHLCVATSKEKQDDIIAKTALSFGLEVYRGDLNDVAKRAFQAAKKYKYSDFLRICGDRPLFDSNIYDELIQEHIKFKNDLTTTIFPRSVPVGFTGEIISTKAMKKLLSLTNNKIDREHVTRFFYKNPKLFSISNLDFNFSKEIINLKFAIDCKEDLEMSRWIIRNIKNQNSSSNSKEIFSLAVEWNKLNNCDK